MKKKKPMDQRKRFFADCPNCTASYEAERYEDTQRYCSCGHILAWSDRATLRTLEGKR